ncbi:AMP-dependent synthetase/ligase [Penicillium brevicompactum]
MPSVIRECVLLQDYGVLSDLNAAGVCLGGANDSIDIADPQNISQPLSWKPEVPGVISGYVLLAIDIDQPTRKAVKSLTLRTETMQFSHFIIFAFAAAMAAEDPVGTVHDKSNFEGQSIQVNSESGCVTLGNPVVYLLN